jgi:hypothetical protein
MEKGEAQFVRELQQEFKQKIDKIRADLETSLKDDKNSPGGGLALATELRRRYISMDAADVIVDLFNTCNQLFPESQHKSLFTRFLTHLSNVPLAR